MDLGIKYWPLIEFVLGIHQANPTELIYHHPRQLVLFIPNGSARHAPPVMKGCSSDDASLLRLDVRAL